jgi:hypothetical protein
LCIISWLAWFLVACVVSKKFIKFLRKSLKKFDLNLKRKNGLKMKFEKKRKHRRLPFQPRRPSSPSAITRVSPPLLLSFFFFSTTLTPGLRLSASPSPFLSSSSPRCPTDPAPPRNPRRARPSPYLRFLSPRPIKAIKLPCDQLGRYFPSLNPSRDGRGHQWQAAGRPVPFPLRLPPCAPI